MTGMLFKFLESRTLFGETAFPGTGYIGGNLPPDPNPNSPDGRTKVEGEPVQMRVLLFDGKSRKLLDETRSKANGTWRFTGLALNHRYAVEFVNENYKDNNGTLYNSLVQDWIYATDMNDN